MRILFLFLMLLVPDIKKYEPNIWELKIPNQIQPQERKLWLLKVDGAKKWVCNDPNCPEHCAEILKKLKHKP